MSAARPDTWIWMPLDIIGGIGNAPAKPGVYAIYFDDEVVYIGQSNNLLARLTRHQIRYGYARNIRTPWGDLPDSVRVHCKYRISRRLGDWAMWEIRLIHRLKPRFNKTFNGSRWDDIKKAA